MNDQCGSHGKEYRVKTERRGQATHYTVWFKTLDELREKMRSTYRTSDAIYIAQQRNVRCKDCAERKSPIEDISPI
jgi:hypothetical protein